MAKALAKYKAAFKKIQADVKSANAEIGKSAQSLGQTVQVRGHGCEQMGLEIQRCKDAGMTGKSPYDFGSDKDVKDCLVSIDRFQGQILKEVKRMKTLFDKDFKKTKKAFLDLRTDMEADIAKREKAKGSKLGKDSASLPDLKKLLVEVIKFGNSGECVSFGAFTPETEKDHEDDLARAMDRAVKETKDVKMSRFQQEMIQQGLDERIVKKRLAQAMKAYKLVAGHCMVAKEAIEARQNKALMQNKVLAAKHLKELMDLADPYKKALADDWIRKKLKDDPKAEKSARAMVKMMTDAQAELKEIANVRLND